MVSRACELQLVGVAISVSRCRNSRSADAARRPSRPPRPRPEPERGRWLARESLLSPDLSPGWWCRRLGRVLRSLSYAKHMMRPRPEHTATLVLALRYP